MLEIIEGLPDNVVGLVVKGRLTRNDCSEILLPKLRKSLDWHYKLRLYYEIRSRFPGAAWEAIDLGLDHLPWERVAIITDVASVRHSVQALRLLLPPDIRVFETSQMAQALAWITSRDARPPHEPGMPGRRRRLDLALPAPEERGRSLTFRPAPQYLSDRTNPG
jgi:SpoIIAA-like